MSTPGPQETPAAIIIGRFQPPTMGHYAVFTAVKKFIKNNPDMGLYSMPIVIVVTGKETGKDKGRNPLSPEDRIQFMRASGRADGVRFITASNAIEGMRAVREIGFEPVAIAAGSDRADQYLELLDRYFTGPGGRAIKHYMIKLERPSSAADEPSIDKDAGLDEILKYVDETIPITMVSGSLARRAVEKDDLAKFTILAGLKEKPELAAKLFKKIQTAMRSKDV